MNTSIPTNDACLDIPDIPLHVYTVHRMYTYVYDMYIFLNWVETHFSHNTKRDGCLNQSKIESTVAPTVRMM